MQDVMVRMLKRSRSARFLEVRSSPDYFFRTARNAALTALRRQRTMQRAATDWGHIKAALLPRDDSPGAAEVRQARKRALTPGSWSQPANQSIVS